jgi:TRAP transporter 4TM/12TM fusion protein
MTGDPPVEQPVPEERPERWADLAAPAPLVALSWSLAQIAFVIWPTINTLMQRGLHVSFACALAFALIARTSSTTGGKWLSWLLAAFAMAPGIYIAVQSDFLMSERIVGLDPVDTLDYVFGFGIIGLLFVAAWRTLGPGLALFAGFFVLYFFVGPYLPGVLAHRYTGVERFIDSQYLSFDGLYGVPTGVSVSTVFYFVLFAAIYDVFGGGRLIIDLALVVTGQRVGGPAKAAVVSSGLLGSVSGSAVANVMSTGIFTIPLMRRGGYAPQFAGGVEAAASTGAQLVPPVMGAAAFIMADFLRVPYQSIVLAAIIPAVVYYVALLLMVHLEARRRGAAAVSAATEPIRDVLLARGHLLLPLVWLAYRIVIGYPVEVAAIEASAATIIMGMLRKSTRRSLRGLIQALVLAAERSVTVAVPCALAGVVVAVISYTGLGTKFTSLMILLAAGQVGVLLVLTMFASLVLGAGMPTTSAYIMAAVLLAPSLTLVASSRWWRISSSSISPYCRWLRRRSPCRPMRRRRSPGRRRRRPPGRRWRCRCRASSSRSPR